MFGFFKNKQYDPDQAILDALKKHHSNLLQPHNIEFFLHLPSRSDAEKAAVRVKQLSEKFQTNVIDDATGKDYLCHIEAVIVPEIATLHRLRQEFRNVCQELGGRYDGWGAEVVR